VQELAQARLEASNAKALQKQALDVNEEQRNALSEHEQNLLVLQKELSVAQSRCSELSQQLAETSKERDEVISRVSEMGDEVSYMNLSTFREHDCY
jgi:malate/lactate dehydrogenase